MPRGRASDASGITNSKAKQLIKKYDLCNQIITIKYLSNFLKRVTNQLLLHGVSQRQ